MKLKELLKVIKTDKDVIVQCRKTYLIGSVDWFLSCLDSRDLISQVIAVESNEYGFIISIDLDRFRI